jgi:hypothetical protein
MKKLITLFMMLILGSSSVFGYQSLVNFNSYKWYGLIGDLQAPYRARVNSDELRNSLVNQQLQRGADYLLGLGLNWVTPQNAVAVANILWGDAIRNQVAQFEGNPMLFENSTADLNGFWLSQLVGHNTNQSVTYRVNDLPSYIHGSRAHTVYDITNIRNPVKLETNQGISSQGLGNGTTQYTVKPAKKGSSWDNYNQVLCVKTGSALYLGGNVMSGYSAPSFTQNNQSVLKYIPTIAKYSNGYRQSEWLTSKNRWSEYLVKVDGTLVEKPIDEHIYENSGVYMSKYRVMVIRSSKNEFAYEPAQYNTYCNILPLIN